MSALIRAISDGVYGAVRHQGQTRPNPDGDARLAARDLVVVMGNPERLVGLEALLEKGPQGSSR